MGRDIQQRTIIFVAVVAASVLSLLPTVLRDNFTQKWFTKPMALGLDISGGVHLVLHCEVHEHAEQQRGDEVEGQLRVIYGAHERVPLVLQQLLHRRMLQQPRVFEVHHKVHRCLAMRRASAGGTRSGACRHCRGRLRVARQQQLKIQLGDEHRDFLTAADPHLKQVPRAML